jgi:hypothetical protein
LLTIDGGEFVDLDDFRQVTEPQIDYARCYALTLFVLLSLLPAVRVVMSRHAGRDVVSARAQNAIEPA